ncbi:MAG: rhomboid family intramembrane serine protease [Gemmatimonadales bacterium]
MLGSVAGEVVAGAPSEAHRLLALVPAELAGRPWAAVTYSFVHSGPLHLLLDMLALLIVATRLEHRRGALVLGGWYLGGVLAGAALAAVAPAGSIVGSTMGVFGVLVGLFVSDRDSPVLRGLPGKGRWVVLALLAAGLLPGVSQASNATVRGAYLGTLLLGFIAMSWSKKRKPERRVEPPNSHFNPPGVVHRDVSTPWDEIDLEALHEVNREAVMVVLRKARELGPTHLTPSEREFLDRMTEASRLGRSS